MENSQFLDTDPHTGGADLSISPVTANFLLEIARWTKFLSILGFVGIGLIVLMALFAGAFLSLLPTGGLQFHPVFFTVIYLSVAALYFFPVYYLFMFSAKLSDALKQKNSSFLETAFENLKSHYKFIGIMAIIVLSLYVIMFLLGIAMGGFALLNR